MYARAHWHVFTCQTRTCDHRYTDSNARERRPYEADGLIASGSRMLLQKNSVMWARHSHSWILTYPTWPVEWLQMTPLLAWEDYWATGTTDLANAYFALLYVNLSLRFCSTIIFNSCFTLLYSVVAPIFECRRLPCGNLFHQGSPCSAALP